MPEIAIDNTRFVELCKNWGFVEIRNDGDHRILKSPTDGQQISVRRGGASGGKSGVNDHTMQLACKSIGMNQTEFLAGPQGRKGSGKSKSGKGRVAATQPRRNLVAFLAKREGMRIDDPDGRLTATVAAALGTQPTALTQLVVSMARDGQIKRDARDKKTFSIELIPNGPRVREMMPLDMVKPVNAPAETPKVGDVREPGLPTVTIKEPAVAPVGVPTQTIDLANYAPDDIAAALMERFIDMIRLGSASIHADVVSGLEKRLGDQMSHTERLQQKNRTLEEDVQRYKERLRQAELKITELQRKTKVIPREVIDGITVNGAPRMGANRVPARR